MLKINELHTGYGKKPVLFGPSLEVAKSEIVAIIGPNGAGKSAILKTICALILVWDGKITFENSCINSSTPAKNVKRGITFCPQGNRVFDKLNVNENLQIGGIHLEKGEGVLVIPYSFIKSQGGLTPTSSPAFISQSLMSAGSSLT